MLTLLREISFRHLRSSPFRSLLVVLGITLGVAMYVATEATSHTMLATFREMVERVSGKADLMLLSNTGGVTSSLAVELMEIEGVEHAAPGLEITTRIAESGETLLVLGVDFLGDMHFLPFDVQEGEETAIEDPIAFANDPTAILIARKLAQRLGLKQDSVLKLMTSDGVRDFHVRGVLDDSGPAASFGGQVAVMFLDAAQVAFSQGYSVDRIDIAVSKDADPIVVQQRIEQKLGKQFRVEKPDQIGSRLQMLIRPLEGGLRLSGIVSLLVGMFLIYNAVGIAVAQRRKEIGLLRSLGVTRLKMVLLFCGEATLLALPGVGLGLLLAQRLALYSTSQAIDAMNTAYVATATAAPTVTLELALRGAIAGLSLAIGAALLPAINASRTEPALALRSSGSMSSPISVPFRIGLIAGSLCVACAWLIAEWQPPAGGIVAVVLNTIGTALMAPGVVVLARLVMVMPVERVLGIPGRLGLDYVERTLDRATLNVLALMVTVSMSITIGGWLASLESSVRAWLDQMTAADFSVTAGSPVLDQRHLPLSPEVMTKLAPVSGIDEMQAMRMVEYRIGDKTVSLVASNTDAFLRNAKRRHKGWRVLRGEPEIGEHELRDNLFAVLGENAAQRLNLDAGDTLTLESPKGAVTFKVRAVVVDYSSHEGSVYIDRKHYLAHWDDPILDVINLYVSPNHKVEQVAEAVRKALGGDGLFVTRTTALRDQLLSQLRQSFAYSRSLELIVLVIALMGVIGTMVSALLDRTREIGMLRAIGTLRRQVTSAVVVEAGFLGFCATAGGIASGALLCMLFLRTLLVHTTGWHLEFTFPIDNAIRISLMVVCASALAGLLPGRRAARMNVKNALSYE